MHKVLFFLKITIYKYIIHTYISFLLFLFMGVRPGVDIQSESKHTGCPEESSAHPRTKDPKETVAGRTVLSSAVGVLNSTHWDIMTRNT